MKILLAEDNLVNQKVACQQLKKFGTQVDVVCDGQQCLEALEGRRDDYDLILTDVQVWPLFFPSSRAQIKLKGFSGDKVRSSLACSGFQE